MMSVIQTSQLYGLNTPHWLCKFQMIYQNLSKDNLLSLKDIYHDDIVFQDPLHKVEGLTDFIAYFENLYTHVTSCTFEITHIINISNEAAVYWEMRYQHKIQERSMNKYRYQWGFYSGQPFFDKMAKDLNRMRIDGPFGSRNAWTKAKVYTTGFVQDVLLKNAIPLALGVAGLYGGFGAKNVHKPFKLFWNRFGAGIRSGFGKMHLPNNFGKAVGDGLEAVGRGIGKMFSKGRAKVTLPLLGVLGFGAHRLTRVHNGEEQRDFFGYNHRPSGQYWDN